MKCYVHPDVDAVGTCTYCGKTVCANCTIEMNGKVVCKSCVERMAMGPSSQPPVQPAAPPVAPPVTPPVPPAAPTVAPPVQSAAQPATPAVPPAAPPAAPVAAPPVVPAAPSRKEPIFSAILSFLGFFLIGLIGLGQIYNGQVKKGIILTVANWVLWFGMAILYTIGTVATLGFGALCCLPAFLVPLILWFYAIYDAYAVANKLNKGEPAKDWLS